MSTLPNTTQLPDYKSERDRIYAELRVAGANKYDMKLPENSYLVTIIRSDEHIMAAVYGKYSKGRGVLVATDKRVLFLDKKPLFLHHDEISFDVISGVTYTNVLFSGTVTLHTRLGDYSLRTFNRRAASKFMNYIDVACLQKHSVRRVTH